MPSTFDKIPLGVASGLTLKPPRKVRAKQRAPVAFKYHKLNVKLIN